MSGNAADGASEPQSLRTLRFGDRTISYDHEGDGLDDGVGGRTSLGIGEEGESQGRQPRLGLSLN